jgi:hypothetical protein
MVASLLIVLEIRFQEVGKKEKFQNKKHDEKLDQNNQPNLLSPTRQVGETFEIKPESTFKNIHSSISETALSQQ